MSDTPPTKPTLLIFAFSWHDGNGADFADGINMSEYVLNALKIDHPELNITKILLPVDYKDIDAAFEKTVKEHNPDYIIGIGERNFPDRYMTHINIEKFANNNFINLAKHDTSAIDLNEPDILEGGKGLQKLTETGST